jgi:digeranylgeranylglycerophospholipid reductase
MDPSHKLRPGLVTREVWTKKIIGAIEYRIRGVDCKGFDFYFLPKISPGGYCWVFRKGDRVANVGIATGGNGAVGRLKEFMSAIGIDGYVEKTTAGGIPSWGPIPRTYTDGVLIAGDAAGQTNPVFLGGIHTAMLGGQLAGQTAVEALQADDTSSKVLSNYEKRWRSLPMADPVLVEAKRILYDMDENRLAAVGRILSNRDLTKLNTVEKAALIARTFLPSNWKLALRINDLYKLVRGLSITRRWGW